MPNDTPGQLTTGTPEGITVYPVGVVVTYTTGTPSLSIATAVGVQVTCTAGTPTILTGATIGATAVQVTCTTEPPTILTGAVLMPSGVLVTRTTGMPAVTTSIQIAASGVLMTCTTGTPTIAAGSLVVVSGVSVTYTTGTAMATGGASAAASGVTITETVGLAVATTSVAIAAVSALRTITTGTVAAATVVLVSANGVTITRTTGSPQVTTSVNIAAVATAILRTTGRPKIGAGLFYDVYGNNGTGGPIDYTTSLYSTTGLSWTSATLAYPGLWKFGVRASNDVGQERNIDAVVKITLDASGVDISRRPDPPLALSGHAGKAGAIILDWHYLLSDPARAPAGFHVYQGTGGTVSYTTPVATVSYASGLRNFTASIPGLTGGTAYSFSVRAFNGVSEETNTVSITVTADTVGPGPVTDLVGMAVP